MNCTEPSISSKSVYDKEKNLLAGTKDICAHKLAPADLSGEMSLELQEAVCHQRCWQEQIHSTRSTCVGTKCLINLSSFHFRSRTRHEALNSSKMGLVSSTQITSSCDAKLVTAAKLMTSHIA